MLDEQDIDCMYQAIGQRVKRARKARGMTQTELAQDTTMVRASIANVEVGRQRLSLHRIVQLAYALNVHPVWLLFGEEPQPVTIREMEEAQAHRRLKRVEAELASVRALLATHERRSCG